jgi:hypothetical protein
MPKEQQTERLGLRITKSEVRMLEELAEATGLSMSDVVRMAIRREHKQRVGDTMADRFAARARRLESKGSSEAAATLRQAAKDLKRPTMAEMARRGFAGERLSKKGKVQ